MQKIPPLGFGEWGWGLLANLMFHAKDFIQTIMTQMLFQLFWRITRFILKSICCIRLWPVDFAFLITPSCVKKIMNILNSKKLWRLIKALKIFFKAKCFTHFIECSQIHTCFSLSLDFSLSNSCEDPEAELSLSPDTLYSLNRRPKFKFKGTP